MCMTSTGLTLGMSRMTEPPTGLRLAIRLGEMVIAPLASRPGCVTVGGGLRPQPGTAPVAMAPVATAMTLRKPRRSSRMLFGHPEIDVYDDVVFDLDQQEARPLDLVGF